MAISKLKFAGIVLGVLFLIGACRVLFVDGETEEDAKAPEIGSEEVAEPEAAEGRPEDIVIKEDPEVEEKTPITAQVQENVRDSIQSSDEILEVGYVEEDKQVVIRIQTQTDTSNDSTKSSMHIKTARIVEFLEEHDEIRIFNIGYLLPLYYQSDNESIEEVMNIVLHKDTYKDINFDKFNPDDFPNIADDYWEHEAIR